MEPSARRGGRKITPLALLIVLLPVHSLRTEVLFNDQWLFRLEFPSSTSPTTAPLPWQCSSPASAALFPITTTGTVVHGLADAPEGASSPAACAAVCAGNCSCQAWQFCPRLLSPPATCGPADAEPPCAFPVLLNGVQCSGLTGVPAPSAADCAAACCAEPTCQVWQYCPPGSTDCSPPGSCWIGSLGSGCVAHNGWLSSARNVTLGSACQTGLLADYGPGNWQTDPAAGANWVGAARLAPPAPPPQATGPAAIAFDESAFTRVQLPHDYLASVAPTSVNATMHQNEHGSIPFANAWYRKHFTVSTAVLSNGLVRLAFDGAYRSAYVFLNGVLAGQHEEGYTGFSVWLHNVSGAPLTAGDNVLAVYLAATTYPYELWGYEGAGIQRDVTLVLHTSAVSIVPWGVVAGGEVAGPVSAPAGPNGPLSADATVSPVVDVANAGSDTVTVLMIATVVDHTGAVVGETRARMSLDPFNGWARLSPPPVNLTSAALWSPANSPTAPRRPLYTLVTQILDVDTAQVLDAVNTTFGIRRVVFDPSSGLTVNGFPQKLRGLSIHQDFAGTGTFVPPNVQAYRVQRTLDIGANAWRCAHNPVDSRLLDELDARGVMVWEENRFLRDFDAYLQDAVDMVARDRNHPSIVLWSLCNENGCGEDAGWEGGPPGQQPGAMLAERFMARIKALDDRPITANAHNTLGANGSILSAVDVMGLTYDPGSLDKMHAERPSAPLLNGESASCQSSRGDEDASGVVGCSRDSWAPADARVWDAGAFVWAGFDYRGETGWPSVVSYYGLLDLCGFDKPVAQWYAAWWGAAAGWPSSAAYVAAWPPWEGSAGGTVRITAVAPAASLQLAVNGVNVGGAVPVPHLGYATWSVPFSAGNYTVTSLDAAGVQVGVFVAITPGPAAALRVTMDWGGSGAGGALVGDQRDAALVAVAVVDASGALVPSGQANVLFEMTGPGELLGLGNGDHQNHSPGQGITSLPTYRGLARAILRGTAPTGAPLKLRVSADADGLSAAEVELMVV
jgi:beta-galactosidase